MQRLRAGDSSGNVQTALAAERKGGVHDGWTRNQRNGLIVEKERVAADGEYNLSGERYRESGPASRRPSLLLLLEMFRKVINPRKILN